jgi:hypothetical protein
MSKKIPVDLNNVTLYWAALRDRNQLSNKFQVDLCELTPEQVATLEDLNIAVRTKGDERGYYVTAKSANYEILPYLPDGTEFKGLVANGSKADVKCEVYEWTHVPTKRSGWSIGIKIEGLTITDLIEYTPPADSVGEEAL